MKLSDLKCRKATAPLYLHVYPNGKKLWRFTYRFAGKQKDLPFGPYPEVSLLEAREKRYEARKVLRDGRDPGAVKRIEEETAARLKETTFEAFAALYLDRQARAGRSAPTLKKAKWIVEDLAAELRPMQIADITPRDVLRVLRAVEAKGNRETARRMRGILSAVFRLAVIEQAALTDPSAPLKGALLPPNRKNHAAVVDPKAFGSLLRVIDGYDGSRVVRLALQILALTFPRPGELRFAEWSEVDFSAKVWTIPASRTKMRREHRIPLSRQAMKHFEDLAGMTGRGRLCFPSIRSADKPLSDGALNAALRALGIDGETHVAHGFRSSASSLLNEVSSFSPDTIERALAHGDPDPIRRAYNRAQYWDDRVRMMQWWADYLDDLKTPPSPHPVVERPATQTEFEFG